MTKVNTTSPQATSKLTYICYTKVSTAAQLVLYMSKLPVKMRAKNGECCGMSACTETIMPVRDALGILSGKWKLPIIIALSFGNKRFSQIANEIPGITDRMLSKELRDLEMNKLVRRKVHNTIPVVVEYSMTEYGRSLENVINELRKWGKQHRQVLAELQPEQPAAVQ